MRGAEVNGTSAHEPSGRALILARYPQGILVSCPIPWTQNFEVDEDLFVRLVDRCVDEGYRHIYVFGTGGEGYAVDTRRFKQVVKLFWDASRGKDLTAMVGVIGLSSPVIVERLAIAHEAGFRVFQISLPSWGALTDDELLAFFKGVCSAFPDSRFLHYNLPRTKRVLNGSDYRRLIAEVPNLVATKTTSGGLPLAADLMRNASELQHFMGEGNFPHGCMYGECSLLASYGELSPARTWALFEAGRRRQVDELFRLQHEFQDFSDNLWSAVKPGPHMDGAYDKMLVKLGYFAEFPLRLLPPYTYFDDADFEALRHLIKTRYADWLQPAAKTH
jgi:dihydrodipicolinate synthase/N-acetylneuraminate lyase